MTDDQKNQLKIEADRMMTAARNGYSARQCEDNAITRFYALLDEITGGPEQREEPNKRLRKEKKRMAKTLRKVPPAPRAKQSVKSAKPARKRAAAKRARKPK
jgi:hypothetical protein